MNWLLIVVIVILAGCMAGGYGKGFLRIAYGLVAWILIFAFVAWSKPYINDFLRTQTTVYEKIVQQCEESIRNSAEQEMEESVAEAELDIKLPEQVLEQVIAGTSQAAGEFLDSSGIYTQIAEGMADFVLDGLSFFIAFISGSILSGIISKMLDIVSKIPILNGTNRFLGLFAGAVNGVVVIWILFYLIALCSSSDIGTALISYIYESKFLTVLYENNLILTFIMKYF